MPSVAVTGEVVATASSATTLSGATGAWTAGPVTEVSYPKLTVGGSAVIHEASCTFTFTDGTTGATVPSLVTLKASSTALQGGLSNVLRADDSKVDNNGNRLAVNITRQAALDSG
ncbi:hypothetical protein GCM10022251_53830 [Phytohabitans flavus]|uniref:Uncharacterized protein n=1 Tax=Phytohabitans flavus TaxID=1076124 RepID=A0A6F8XM35_9ACTN|nr:hypothetical protein [Phytohabitans flavus]BCB74849.1 hypothetical protein Pflav_012590 [Phytohabitans flavus]